MGSVTDWLRLFRAHTASVEVIIFLSAYVLAGGRDLATALALMALAHLVHYTGFGHNSVVDYLTGFDRSDPSKRHHPLPAGRLDPVKTLWVVHSMIFAASIAMLILAFRSPHPLLASSFLLTYIIWGFAYNTGIDHLSRYNWLAITINVMGLAGYAYTIGPNFDPPVLAAVLAMAATIEVYEIAWEGNLKDLWNPEDRAPDILRDYCTVHGETYVCRSEGLPAALLSSRLVYYLIVILLGVLHLYPSGWLMLWPIALGITGMILTDELHQWMLHGTREEALRFMGLQEVVAFYTLGLLALPMDLRIMGIAIVYSLPYYAVMNKILWGSPDTPRV